MHDTAAKTEKSFSFIPFFVGLYLLGLCVVLSVFLSVWFGVLVIAPFIGLIVYTWLAAPVSFEKQGADLVVKTRLGEKKFADVQSVKKLDRDQNLGWRVFGNGGLFCVSGYMRNKDFGDYQIFVTNRHQMVLADLAADKKIVFSPAHPEKWLSGSA